ncbi:hypothetical protein OSG_eHP18_00170 [environmental Halophage eHP-18]|nr:hypothetical protein OSG_eHP17_00080 [environmental Halophage eHP-17]AFH22191.1 hypothetical protein OSG_eHP18_00170 [environmental Halophage eHP-18]AFH22719.1 hypothetical protein OSG_eHP33_00080 [environmental Halophage eHP-33]
MVVDAIVSGVGDFLGWVLIALGGGILSIAGYAVKQTYDNQRRISDLEDETKIRNDPTRLEDHEHRMSEQERHIRDLKEYFTGDPDDPSNPGLLSEIHEIKQQLEDRDD